MNLEKEIRSAVNEAIGEVWQDFAEKASETNEYLPDGISPKFIS